MKKIVPVIITIIVICYLMLYLLLPLSLFGEGEPIFAKVLVIGMAAIAAGMIVAMISTLITRLKEINKEDEDDLSQY